MILAVGKSKGLSVACWRLRYRNIRKNKIHSVQVKMMVVKQGVANCGTLATTGVNEIFAEEGCLK